MHEIPFSPRRALQVSGHLHRYPKGIAMEALLTAVEVAQILGVHVNWVYREASRRRLPSLMVGRQRRFRRADIERWLDECGAA